MSTEISITVVMAENLLRDVILILESPPLMLERVFRKLEVTSLIIKQVLLDTQGKEESLSYTQRRYMEELKEAIYDADDLVDNLIAHRHRRRLRSKHSSFCNIILNILLFPCSLRSVGRVQKRCHTPASFLNRFGVLFSTKKNSNNSDERKVSNREETLPFVYSSIVIGRERDVKAVLDMLISYDYASKATSFLSIFGMGGLGKTTLAQLVFNHDLVASYFDIRLWVCVGEDFDFEAILAKLLESATGRRRDNHHTHTLTHNHNQVLSCLRGKRFLLVLDDVWTENVNHWDNLRQVLMTGANGTCILATTRSRRTANMIADQGCVYELPPLSETDSWRLFNFTAFDQVQQGDSQLVEIGKSIVARCANLPLALKVVGTTLNGQHRHMWLAFQRSMMHNALYDSPNLMSILKLSFDQLPTPLKCCFTFCALFPKGFKIRKDLLVALWMAQGYIRQPPAGGEETAEDIADTYFTVLLERDFFQNVVINEYGDVVSCTIHDLMHDLAQQLAGEGIRVEKNLANIPAKALHVFHDAKDNPLGSFGKTRLRTYLQSGFHAEFPVATLIANCKALRALALHDLADRSLPDSIGKLIHLRYLDLSGNKRLEMLPRSLTKLCYLETLDLRDCSNLEELPSDLSKLTFLRCLDILGCDLLTRMPSNMNKLTRLCTLTLFVVDEGDSGGKLEDLKALHNLKGCIEISIPANYTTAEKNEIQGKCLREMALLKAVALHFRGSGDENRDSTLLEKLQPHQNLKSFTLKGYQGSAVHWVAFLKNLVKLELVSCEGLIHLSFLSNLAFLESLILHNLVNLEYMEDVSNISASPGSNELAFFPSLKYLSISGMCNLKRWWGNVDLLDGDLADNFRNSQLSFKSLSHLNIQSCPELASFPECLNVEKLCLTELNTALSIFDLCPDWHSSLTELEVDHVGYLKSPSHERVHISTKLRRLKIGGRSQQFSHVTSEESIRGSIKWDSEDDGPWKLLHQSLQTLELDLLEKMVSLPKGMQHLTALQHLFITDCNNLKVIPEWISCLAALETLRIISCTGLNSLPESMRKLTSLRHLEIQGPTYLRKRCQPIHGEDWPKIQHIPSISFQEIS